MPPKAVFETALADTWDATEGAKIGDKPGDLRWEGNKCYKCVIFNNGAGDVAAIAGMAAYYYAVSGAAAATTGHLNHTVTMDLTDTHELGAGIFQSVPADAERCWVQIKGPATGTATLITAGADGDPLTVTGAANDGELDVVAADTSPICAFIDDATAEQIICEFPF